MPNRNQAIINAARERAQSRSVDESLPEDIRSTYEQIARSYEIEDASHKLRKSARKITNAFEAGERAAARAAKEAADAGAE